MLMCILIKCSMFTMLYVLYLKHQLLFSELMNQPKHIMDSFVC